MNFKNIYGHENIYETLKFQKEHNSLSHSYIFSGKKGIGKMKVAKSFSQSVFCKTESFCDCGYCSSCLKFLSENHPDFMVIIPDGKSIKNEQMEAMQKFVSIKPFESEYKIIIIDEAHKMTERAQNRILKTIEEPPSYALFIFVTHQKDKLLETLLSRCVEIRFNDLTYNDIIKILKENQVKDYETVAHLMHGQIVECFLTEDYSLFKNEIKNFTKALSHEDRDKVIEFGKFINKHKSQYEVISHLLIMWFRDIIIYQEIGHQMPLMYKNDIDIISALSEKISKKELLLCIEWFQEAEEKVKNNMNFDLTVDYVIIRVDQLLVSRRKV